MSERATTSSTLMPTLAVLGAVALWGSSFAATKVAVGVFHPLVVIWARMAVSSLIFLALLPRLETPARRAGDIRLLAVMVVFLPGLYFPLENVALTLTTSSQAGMIAATVPVLVAVGARLVYGERISVLGYLGLAIAILGVVGLTVAAEPDTVSAPDPVLGNLLEALAMCCSCGYVLTVKALSARYGGWMLSGIQCLGGAVLFLPALALVGDSLSDPALPAAAGAVAYLGGVVTLVAFGLYNHGIGRMSATRATAYINLVPVVAVLIGWVALGETLTFWQMVASGVVMGGVLLGQAGARS